MMSAVLKTSPRLARTSAPLSTYAASGYPASTPAPASITTSRPAFARLGTTPGTRATRRSPGKLSRGTPTIIGPPCKFPNVELLQSYLERKEHFTQVATKVQRSDAGAPLLSPGG